MYNRIQNELQYRMIIPTLTLLRYQVRHQSYKIYFYIMTNISITTKANKFANEEGHSYHYDHYLSAGKGKILMRQRKRNVDK